jgi:hypothetical protein
MIVRNVDKRDPAVDAGNGHRFDPGLQAAPAFFDDLVGEPGVILDSFRRQHFFDQRAYHVAAGDPGALVENPILGGADIALALMQPVTQRRVVDAGLAAGYLQTVAEA